MIYNNMSKSVLYELSYPNKLDHLSLHLLYKILTINEWMRMYGFFNYGIHNSISLFNITVVFLTIMQYMYVYLI